MTEFAANLLGVVGLAVAERIERTAREILAHAGETSAALVVIGYGFGPSNDQLKRVLGLSHPGTVRLVDRLVADDLVVRKRGTDKRAVALFLTDRGKQYRARLLKQRLAAIQPLLDPLSANQKAEFTELLRTILAGMDTSDLERRHLCRLCDDSVCYDCPIPANFRET